MIITCEQCQARFRLADEKLKPGGTKVRCSKCKHVFTVLPPETAPEEATVDFGDFNMERVGEEESAPTPPEPEAPAPASPAQAVAPAPGEESEIDFSGLEQSMGPGTGGDELAEDFSFADTTAPAEPPPSDATESTSIATAFDVSESPTEEPSGELDFDATFAETADSAGYVAGPAEFAFEEESAPEESPAVTDEPGEFSFDSETAAPAPEAFDFGQESTEPAADAFAAADEPSTPDTGAFNFESSGIEDRFAFDEGTETTAATDAFSFDTEAETEPSPFGAEPAFGEEGGSSWDQPEKESAPTFDFDEPSFETQTDKPPAKSGGDSSLGFGEIDFSGEEGGTAPAFGAEPDFSQATLARPAEADVPPPPPPPRPAASRPRSDEPLPLPVKPRKSAMSGALVALALLFLALCGAGGYFYFMGDGQQMVDRLLLKIKGEEPAAPVEQKIGLAISGSSYVDNREAGQLLVIQGTATNNFSGARSAITVKGLLLDAGGKILQQQTVFCGNYLGDEKLRTLKYAQIEEAMNNQFGDSLSNMNLKPGATIRFTIVFRNLPKDLANINVEVVDSKQGGL